jgi:hypothetical protein
MPPRYAYWTIIAGGLPTAFRAADRDDLVPTFQRIREKHPDAEMKWFARGKLWASPEEAQSRRPQDARPPHGDRPQRDSRSPRDGRSGDRTGASPKHGGPADRGARIDRDHRDRDWRPGGEHRDPRQKYKDAKKARNQTRRDERFARKHGGAERTPRPFTPREEKPGGWPKTQNQKPGAWSKPREDTRGGWPKTQDRKPGSWSKPRQDRPGGWSKPRGPATPPHGDKLQSQKDHGWRRDRPQTAGSARPFERKQFNRPPGDRTPSERKPFDRKPFDRKPFDRERPAPRGDWRDRGPRDRWRAQGTEEPPPPPRPRGPNREPRPGDAPPPAPPPRPTEPREPPSQPPERGGDRKPRRRR